MAMMAASSSILAPYRYTVAAAFASPQRIHRLSKGRLISSLSSTSSSSPAAASSSQPRKLVLYSKPGCCLCDGLKEKLNAAFSFDEVDLQVRDITSNPKWENAYQYEIPVLARVLPDGSEEVLPRLSPRLSVELIQKKISAALKQ